jgi:hypothetical protein
MVISGFAGGKTPAAILNGIMNRYPILLRRLNRGAVMGLAMTLGLGYSAISNINHNTLVFGDIE